MKEKDFLALWARARFQIIVSQAAPTFLLAVTAVALEAGLVGSVAARLAAAGILLASGILGFIAQFTAAAEGQAIAADLRGFENPSAVSKRVTEQVRWMFVVKYVTPTIFVLIYLDILWAMFIGPFGKA